VAKKLGQCNIHQGARQHFSLNPKYAIENGPTHYINELIIDTDIANRYLDSKIENTFRYLATKKIKQIMATNTQNTLHKKYQLNLNK
jgi:hypothetical protein